MHKWHNLPVECSKCGYHITTRPVGRPARYPALATLQVGQTIVIPWDAKNMEGPSRAADRFAKRKGWRLRVDGTYAGVRISRLPDGLG